MTTDTQCRVREITPCHQAIEVLAVKAVDPGNVLGQRYAKFTKDSLVPYGQLKVVLDRWKPILDPTLPNDHVKFHEPFASNPGSSNHRQALRRNRSGVTDLDTTAGYLHAIAANRVAVIDALSGQLAGNIDASSLLTN